VEQGRNLTAMLSVAAVRQLGRRHIAYGVKPQHFRTVEDAMLFALEHALIDVFTPEVKAAWQAAYAFYAFFSSTMLEASTPTASPAAP
jgi:hemoglobin-like flavoprotein